MLPSRGPSLVNSARLFFLLLIYLFSRPASADDTKVLIVGSKSRQPLIEALQLELNAAAFETRVEWRSPRPELFTNFTEAADETDTEVWIRLFDDGRVDIWTTDPETDEVLHRDIVLDDESRNQPLQAAMAIAELLRATRLEPIEVETGEPSPSEETPFEEMPSEETPSEETSSEEPPSIEPPTLPEETPETPVPEDRSEPLPADTPTPPSKRPPDKVSPVAEAAPRRHRLLLELGPGITAGDFSYPPAAGLHLSGEWRFAERIGAVILGQVPLMPTRADDAHGSAAMKNGIVGIEARSTFPKFSKHFRPSIGVGAALAITRVEGEAEPGYVSQDDTRLTARLHLSVSAAVPITERLAFTFGATLAHSLAGVTVAVAGEPTIIWGDIILDGYLGLEIALL